MNTGGSASGTVTVKPPASTASGTDVTLTILAEGPGAIDSNYAVLRLSVLTEVTWLCVSKLTFNGPESNIETL